jgi:hypothetical protein
VPAIVVSHIAGLKKTSGAIQWIAATPLLLRWSGHE